MRVIVHLSDIHFGKIDTQLIHPLVREVHEMRPHLVVVSGDLTQRARRNEYRQAREFLKLLPGPQIVVPGNHDVPIFNPIARFVAPLARFKRYITPNLYPFFEDDEMAILGLNTARSRTTKYGHINRDQLYVMQDRLCAISDDKLKVIVTHHPFDVPEGYRNMRQIVGKSKRAMRVLAECGADLFLAGHLHRAFIGHTAERYQIENFGALIVQAGTIAKDHSARQTGFNHIVSEEHHITVSHYEWSADVERFQRGPSQQFQHTAAGWKAM